MIMNDVKNAMLTELFHPNSALSTLKMFKETDEGD